MREFPTAAHRLKRDLLDAWWNRWRDGPPAATLATGGQPAALKAGDLSPLDHGEVSRLEGRGDPVFGTCGRLRPRPVPVLPTRPPRGASESSHPHPPKELS